MATKIFVDAGHGGTDPGAVGNGVTEQYVNLSVARRLANLLRAGGYEVMEYRTTTTENVLPGKSADLTNRARMANNWGADYFISIHTNSSPNPAANGVEAYVYRLGGRAEALAESILRSFVARLGSKNNGVRAANFAVLRQTDMPLEDRIVVMAAIGQHDESTGGAKDAISAALILADKTDVRRNIRYGRSARLCNLNIPECDRAWQMETEAGPSPDF